MKKKDLNFTYPESLIAQVPVSSSRIFSALNDNIFSEISWDHLLDQFNSGDLLILNDTKVLSRRIYTSINYPISENKKTSDESFEQRPDELEILFLKSLDTNNTQPETHWQVLMPAKKLKIGQKIPIPGGRIMTLIQKGIPQEVVSSLPLNHEYFEMYGEVPLPPYIQKMRSNRRALDEDKKWYQSQWAEKEGSFAAPTASLHFKSHHLEKLKQKGVKILKVTLHVGLGTFMPVYADDLKDHSMHSEVAFISKETWEAVQNTKSNQGKVWALGTTVARVLESAAHGLIPIHHWGETSLLILPGFDFKVVDNLLTNFHQPESTLLALLYAFAGTEKVKKGYQWAIENQFRLFSYGDLSVWKRE